MKLARGEQRLTDLDTVIPFGCANGKAQIGFDSGEDTIQRLTGLDLCADGCEEVDPRALIHRRARPAGNIGDALAIYPCHLAAMVC